MWDRAPIALPAPALDGPARLDDAQRRSRSARAFGAAALSFSHFHACSGPGRA